MARPLNARGEDGGARNATRTLAASVAFLLAALVAACGGGSADAPRQASTGTLNPTLAASSTLAARCAAPRPSGATDVFGQLYGDRAGTLSDEKLFLRSWTDETYLWYQDVRQLSPAVLNAASYATPVDYFDALRSPLFTASGAPKDQFHFTYDTATYEAESVLGEAYGYGFTVALLASVPPREAAVAYADPGTPAAAAGIARGARILAVDGVDLVNDNTGAGIDTLNEGLFPSSASTHTLRVLDLGATTPRNVTLTAGTVTSVPVQNAKALPSPYQSVGYLQFNDHIATSEQQLVAAIGQLQAAGVTDLVLDVRYNGGGYLDIASELAYMIAGPTRTAGKVFERLSFNDKNPFGLTDAERDTPFHAVTQGFSTTAGQALPTLGLGRVYVLAGSGTCSASEAIVNGLRGAGVQVVLVGSTSCGKPYGFYAQENCGTTYFTIQFKGVNALGFGDYADGFAPTCAVSDDFQHALGDVAEARLAVALGHRETGSCQRAAGLSAATRASVKAEPVLVRSALRENRLYRRH
jgi:hypothetical protein